MEEILNKSMGIRSLFKAEIIRRWYMDVEAYDWERNDTKQKDDYAEPREPNMFMNKYYINILRRKDNAKRR